MTQPVTPALILASASPRRHQLLQQIGIENVWVKTADIDESPDPQETPQDYVQRLALEKALAVQAQPQKPDAFKAAPILAADTIIALDGQLLGKPRSKSHAIEMWRAMSGREHDVYSGVALIDAQQQQVVVQQSRVLFADITLSAMETYWRSGEPCDKAGAYAVQGQAACWIKNIEGSYSSIMGLPLHETAVLLKHYGFPVLL